VEQWLLKKDPFYDMFFYKYKKTSENLTFLRLPRAHSEPVENIARLILQQVQDERIGKM
jgi:hypothetical protein